ncbi:MAG TPA: hypothetical protein VFZ37_17325 [Jiangellaceae bacterium]
MAGEHALVPHVRTALAARAVPPLDGAGAGHRAIRIGVQVMAEGVAQGAPHQVAAELFGAGDIVSLDPSMVARVEPGPTSRAVEPNYFPYVDFRDADFPWRYTLDAGTSRRLRPWLLVVALEASEFRHLGGGGGLARIEVFDPSASLPNPEQSWAFAHVQVNRAGQPGDLAQTLRTAPEAGHARLLCPRRLGDNTPYTLALVPTYEAGRLAGLGARGPAEPWDAFAWDVARTEPVELPVYRQWTFRTSTLEDFESLVRRLQPVPTDAETPFGGTRTVFAGRPGYYDDVDDPELTFEAEGALHHLDFERQVPVIEETALTPRLEQTLTAVVQSDLPQGADDGPEQEDPLVALPVYGRHFARPEAIEAAATSTPWVHEVTLDPRLRLAAGVGARIVRRHQEPFMEKCWQQVGELHEANRLRARLQLLTRLNEVVARKRLVALSAPEAAQVSAPLFHAVKTPFGDDRTLRADLRVRGIPDGLSSPLARRLAAKRAGAGRTFSPQGAMNEDRARPFAMATGVVDVMAGQAVPSSVDLARAASRVDARRLTVADASDLAQLIPEPLAAVHAVSFDRPTFEVAPVDGGQIVDAVVARLHELPRRKAADRVAGLASDEAASLEPLVRSPRLPIPLSGHVAEEDANHLLPGVDALPDNSATLLVENRAFIEALMAGANHEMNREMRWRELSTDMRSSVFTRFWGSGHAPDDTAADDLPPLHQWEGRTGTHFGQGDQANLVLVIHGDLVRRYPDVLVAMNRQVVPPSGQWEAERGTTTHPVFTGVIGDSAGFYGFDLAVDELRADLDAFYFVLYEPANRFRFGLDIATYGARTSRRDLGRAPMPFPLATLVASHRAVRIRSVRDFWNVPPAPVGPVPRDPDDLSWEHVTLDAAGYIDVDQAISFADGSDLLGPARTSASIARATLQRPVAAVVPARRMVTNA